MKKRDLTASLVATAVLLGAAVSTQGQTTNPRFGVWKMRSDAPPPAINIMTYEPYGDGGMGITVESTKPAGSRLQVGLRHHVRRGVPHRHRSAGR